MKKLNLLFLLLTACGGGHAHHDAPTPGHKHHFHEPEKFAARWDAPERDVWQKPEIVLETLKLAPDAKVADVGAGTGYFTVRLAGAVPEGTVYAVDVSEEMVEYLRERIAEEKLANVKVIRGAADSPGLPEPVDMVFLSNTYHHVPDRSTYFANLKQHLRPGGRVAVLDYKKHFEGHGPPPHMRLSPEQVEAEMTAAGYRVAARNTEAFPRQYLLVFEPAP